MSNSRTPSPTASLMTSTSQEDFTARMLWVIVYFNEDDRWMSDEMLLRKMRLDIKDRMKVTWTPIDPGLRPYSYPILVITVDDDLEEIFTTAQIIIETFIEEYRHKGAPFRREDIFPPMPPA